MDDKKRKAKKGSWSTMIMNDERKSEIMKGEPKPKKYRKEKKD